MNETTTPASAKEEIAAQGHRTDDGSRWHRERGRLHPQDRRSDDNSECTLLVVNEADGSWTVHGLGAPGLRLSRDVIIGVAESILKRAR